MPRSCSGKHCRLSEGLVAPVSQEPWGFAAETGVGFCFGGPQVIPSAWVDAALLSHQEAGWRKSGVQGTWTSTLRSPHLLFLFWGRCKGCPAVAEGRPAPRSWPIIVSATRWLAMVLDWGALCSPSTTDSPSCCQLPLDPPGGGHSLRNFSFPSLLFTFAWKPTVCLAEGMHRVLVHFRLFPWAVLPVKWTNGLAAGGRWNGD